MQLALLLIFLNVKFINVPRRFLLYEEVQNLIPVGSRRSTRIRVLVTLRNRTVKGSGCVSNVTGLSLATICCLDLHLTLMFSGLLQKDLSKGR